MLGSLKHQLHFTLFPGFLIFSAPQLVLVVWYTIRYLNGSLYNFYEVCVENGLLRTISAILSVIDITSPVAIRSLAGFMLWTVLLQILIPGRNNQGPVTDNGNVPYYKDNGFYNYVITMAAFVGLTYVMKTYYNLSTTLVYDHFGDILALLNIFSFILCFILYVKGIYIPSSSDNGSSGNFVFDYYWGTELYPRIFNVDVKVFTNCRFGMTAWPLLCTVCAIKNYELHGFIDSTWVSWFLYMAYFTKFFWWEAGYMRTIDIAVDRAGFYLCWGCLVFVPGLYASPSFYLVSHPIKLGWMLSFIILTVGLLSLAVNYLADKQKQDVRANDGKCKIWGKPAEIIRAKYTLKDGNTQHSILLVNGYWGIARHFHYVPELILAFSWTVPALFENVLPYLYFIVLFTILVQ